MLFGITEDSQIRDRLQLLKCLLQNAILTSRYLGENLTAVADQQLDVLGRLARQHVLGKDKQLIARALDDDIDVTDHDHGGSFVGLAADGHCRDPGTIDWDLNRLVHFAILLIISHCISEAFVGIDQGDIERFDAPGQMQLAEIVGQVNAVQFDRNVLQIPGGHLDDRFFITAEFAFGDDF